MLPPTLSPKQSQLRFPSIPVPAPAAAVAAPQAKQLLPVRLPGQQPTQPAPTSVSISEAPQTFDVSGVVTSYFPRIPAPDISYFPPSAPTICSPLPPATPPAFPRRPSSAGQAFVSGRPSLSVSTSAHPPSSTARPATGLGIAAGSGGATDIGVAPTTRSISPVSATSGSRTDNPSFRAYAASRIAQAAAAASAAKDSAVARLHAKHQAWSRTAHSQISALPPTIGQVHGQYVDGERGASGTLADIQHKHQRSASAGSALHLEQQQRDFAAASASRRATDTDILPFRPHGGPAVPQREQQSSSIAQQFTSTPGYIDYSRVSITGLTPSPTPPLVRPTGRASDSTSSSISTQLLTPNSRGSGPSASRSRSATFSYPASSSSTSTYDPSVGISPTIFQRGNSIWTSDLHQSSFHSKSHTDQPRTRHPSTAAPSAAGSSLNSPISHPADTRPSTATTTQSASNKRMSMSDTSSYMGAGPSGTNAPASSSAGPSKGKKQKFNKDGTPKEGKRKKVSKACLACQKSHLTCDEQRPCTRCVKKGVADQCVEGVRKKAKYLLEADDRGSPDHSESPPFTGISSSDLPQQPPLQPSLSSTSIPGLATISESNHPNPGILPNINPGTLNVGGVGDIDMGLDMSLNMNLGGIANLPSLTSTGVYSLDSTMDPPGMDVWLAPAPAHQTLVQGVTLDGRDGDGNRASSPILGMDGDRDVDWGGLFGGGTNSYGFGTTATNEYAMLDAMLNSMSPVFPFDLGGDGMQMDLDNLGSNSNVMSGGQGGGFGAFGGANDASGMSRQSLSGPQGLGLNPLNSTTGNNLTSNQAQNMVSPEWPNDGPIAGFTPPGGLSGQVHTSLSHAANAAASTAAASSTDPWAWSQPQSQQRVVNAGQQGANQGFGLGSQTQVQGVKSEPGFKVEPDASPVLATTGAAADTVQSGAGAVVSDTAAATSAPTGTGPAPVAAPPMVTATGGGKAGAVPRLKSGAEVYHSVTKPFDYTEGYHVLMEWMSKSFEQREVLRVVKALAAFRPSLIALQMPMSEEDEVFLERSFQRTLIELEKLISYSATPTAVWRRTGDLVYANPEFCSLLGKQQNELLSGKTYIYHLFAKQSVITYWENFSVHAFENTTQNFFQATTLQIGPKQTACSCCFTIRRDVFDLPSVIIGQFLPIPAE